MNAKANRAPRKIVMPSEDDNQHEKANKAFSILLEFTSRRFMVESLKADGMRAMAIHTGNRMREIRPPK